MIEDRQSNKRFLLDLISCYGQSIRQVSIHEESYPYDGSLVCLDTVVGHLDNGLVRRSVYQFVSSSVRESIRISPLATVVSRHVF